jgi:hypothetical protein
MKPNFVWWTGVVEDRADPEKMGRYRVRILGFHTEDRAELPVSDLPWATPIMPVSSSSNTGVCETPSLVEGTAVIGFFSDGVDEQLPIIVGSIPGMPQQKIEDPNVGFSDPTGEYPRYLNEPDISKLARDSAAENHESLISKRETRIGVEGPIVTAKAPSVSTMLPDKSGKDYDGSTWEEPHPRFGSTDQGTYTEAGQAPTFDEGVTSVYPFNQVKETESGHVFETDDTPANGRIHEYHNAGTFREIQADGKRITKVVGADYEVILEGKNVYIQGGCNVNIVGDCKMRVDGDFYQEIDGDYFMTVTGDRIAKINGNDIAEIGTDQGININGNRTSRVGGDNTDSIVGTDIRTIGKDKILTVNQKLQEQIKGKAYRLVEKSSNEVVLGDRNTLSGAGIYFGADGIISAKSGGDFNITSNAAHTVTVNGVHTIEAGGESFINNNLTVDGTIDATGDVSTDAGAGVTLATHKHIGSPTAGTGPISDTGTPK